MPFISTVFSFLQACFNGGDARHICQGAWCTWGKGGKQVLPDLPASGVPWKRARLWLHRSKFPAAGIIYPEFRKPEDVGIFYL
ncbi:hypothetical protein HMPREF3038_02265 [Akkermansia sp. KLE1797]|nr:hypothetical protein HMPREF3038_02265 [Akkermansia sp. KLE1797]